MPKSVLLPGSGIIVYEPDNPFHPFTLKEARAEYSRLRKIAEKRLKRMAASSYGRSDIYRRYKDAFQPLPRGASEERVRKKLYEVAKFTELKTASVSGMKESRRKQVEAMQEQGYTRITEENIDAFNDYMERVKRFTAAKNYDSEEIVDLFLDVWEAYGDKVDPDELAEDFEDYLEGIKDIPEPPEEDEEDEEALDELQPQRKKQKKQPAAKQPKKPAPKKQKKQKKFNKKGRHARG